MTEFLWWLHHNITAGLQGQCSVQIVDGRLFVDHLPFNHR